ncbi:MAG TPA: hypothetical protein VGS12_00790 [Caulobacteraceae bacterium]|nr:hypothetical protein [Caulobacteraceae bacterium]
MIIVGFHRSGTSMLTRILHKAGLFVGEELLGGIPSNPYGHFEDKEILSFHDRVLGAQGFSWMFDGDADELVVPPGEEHWMRTFVGRRNSLHDKWGFKDPRVCLFLPQWSRVAESAMYVVVFRDFLETTQSLLNRQSRDIILQQGDKNAHLRFWRDPGLALRMWVSHNRAVLRFVERRRASVLCVRHRQLLAGYPLLQQLRERGFDLDGKPDQEMVDPEATNTRLGPLIGLQDPALAEARRLWARIEGVTGGKDFDIDERIAEAVELSATNAFDGHLPGVGSHDPKLMREYNQLFSQSRRSPAAKETQLPEAPQARAGAAPDGSEADPGR